MSTALCSTGIRLLAILLAAMPVASAQYHELAAVLNLARQPDSQRAVAEVQKLIRSHPDFFRGHQVFVELCRSASCTPELLSFYESWLERDPGSAAPHYGLAVHYRSLRNWNLAERHAEQARRKAPQWVFGWWEWLTAQLAQNRADEADTLLQAAVRDNPENPAIHFALGELRLNRRQYGRAAESFLHACRLREDDIILQEALVRVYDRQHRYQDAVVLLERMLATAERAGDVEARAGIYGRLGMYQADLGRFAAAAGSLEFAVSVARDLRRKASEQRYLHELAIVRLHMGELGTARAHANEALQLALSSKDVPSQGRIEGVLASSYAAAARYREAIAHWQSALAVAKATTDEASEADVRASLARVLAETGRHALARAEAAEALGLAERLKNPWLRTRLLAIAAFIEAEAGSPRQAAVHYRQTLDSARAGGDRMAETEALLKLARFSEAGSAREMLRSAIATATASKIPALEALARIELSRVLPRQEAFAELAGALRIAAEIASPAVLWPAHAAMGRWLEAGGDHARALQNYDLAIQAVEATRASLLVPEDRSGYFASKVPLYAAAARCSLRSGAREGLTRAFEYVDRSRARSYMDLLAAAGMPEFRPTAEETELRAAVERARSQLLSAGGERIVALQRKLQVADHAYQAFLWNRRQRAPAEFGVAATPDLLRIQSALPARTVLLEFLLDDARSYVFAVTKSDIRVLPIAGRATVENAAKRFRSLLVAGRGRGRLGELVVAGHEAYRLILGSVLPKIPPRSDLMIVPDGALRALPFEALLTQQEPDSYLIRNRSIRYALSAASVVSASPSASFSRSLLAFGGPSYPPGGSFRELPESRREVQALARLYGSEGADVLVGGSASEAALKSRDNAGGYRTLHLAVHGVADDKRPHLSALAFSALGDAASGEDGMLHAFEILQMRFANDLVVLSACETGLGREITGEGITGLAQAFLYAGARSVVTSLWKVDDRATAELMIRFHRYLRSGARPEEALRRARLDLLGSGELSHPSQWAGFTLLIGNAGASQPPHEIGTRGEWHRFAQPPHRLQASASRSGP